MSHLHGPDRQLSPMTLLTLPLFRLLLVLAVLGLVVPLSAQDDLSPIFQPAPPPLPSSLQVEADLRLEVYFPALNQGGIGLLRLNGDGIERAHYTLRSSDYPFVALADDAWYALVAVDMETAPRSYPLTIVAQRAFDAVTFKRDLRINDAGYYVQNLDLSADRAYLSAVEIEAREFERLANMTGKVTPLALWDETGFERPLDTALATPFGTYRILTDGRRTRHTGWDQQAAVGTPIRAIAAGEVVFADSLEIRGNTVLVNHGQGIYSLYAHFSDLLVAPDQRIAAGQIIGLSGNTGRSSAPHLHWEVLLRGRWIDGLAFLDLWLPS